ncbi:hypothetical protein [Streptomyces candidus]|uniref:Uncharacterized protein n=1 Tax=Streptomyces candidus TaxID=67283 RepID=A0A7X0LSL7_9ACTN|nr:hypothetical protein [Streptomyces candidus]MBB6439813.1 hypothetical protein [Streptomyces candidus]GHH57151.1 hypothetical protein GCM10018773_64100 [Streptomyces candidus]
MTAPDVARALSGLLEASHTAPFEQLPRLLDSAAKEAGAGGAWLFVADLQEEVLREVTGFGLSAGEGGEEFPIEGTLPGRAYQTAVVTAPARGGACWVGETALVLEEGHGLGHAAAQHSRSAPPQRLLHHSPGPAHRCTTRPAAQRRGVVVLAPSARTV